MLRLVGLPVERYRAILTLRNAKGKLLFSCGRGLAGGRHGSSPGMLLNYTCTCKTAQYVGYIQSMSRRMEVRRGLKSEK